MKMNSEGLEIFSPAAPANAHEDHTKAEAQSTNQGDLQRTPIAFPAVPFQKNFPRPPVFPTEPLDG